MLTTSTSAQACIRQPTCDGDTLRRVARPLAATFPHDTRESLVRRLQQSRPCRLRTTLNATDSSQQEQTPSRQDLEVELQDAIRLEQYTKAAELRDALKSLQPQDTAFSLKKKLDAFVAEERFEEAAAVRDELRSVVAHNIEEARKRTTSDAVTEGVRVQVKSYFVPNQSYPQHRQYFFAYSVTIKNESNQTVQLLSRHWVIHNAEGQKQEVR
ncbi:MAG: hypothetical protein FRX49_05194 [Trebouxia sp. A1-2]|nr:MAG: hypothetical protein FRX49_05194 [Trebouxia sp. A1-2]